MSNAIAHVVLQEPVLTEKGWRMTVDYSVGFRGDPTRDVHLIEVQLCAWDGRGDDAKTTWPPYVKDKVGVLYQYSFPVANRSISLPWRLVRAHDNRVTGTVTAVVAPEVVDEDPGADPASHGEWVLSAADEVYARVLVDGDVAGSSERVTFHATGIIPAL